MHSFRKWFYRPKRTDTSLLAQFYYADDELNSVTDELDSFDGRKDPERCTVLVNQLRSCQNRVLNICNRMMDEVFGDERAPRDFRAKFPDEVLQDNLAGQLWFGAECLAAGSCIMNRERESVGMRPLAKAVTKSLDVVRVHLREQCLRSPQEFNEKLCETLKIFDRLFAEFELRYVSAMVPVKSTKEYTLLQDVVVLFSETVQRALRLGLLSQDQMDMYDPALMFTIPRLAIVAGLVVFPNGPLRLDRDIAQISELFRPFKNLLCKIRELLWTLTKPELFTLERYLCSVDEPVSTSTADFCQSKEKAPEGPAGSSNTHVTPPDSAYPALDIDRFIDLFYTAHPHCRRRPLTRAAWRETEARLRHAARRHRRHSPRLPRSSAPSALPPHATDCNELGDSTAPNGSRVADTSAVTVDRRDEETVVGGDDVANNGGEVADVTSGGDAACDVGDRHDGGDITCYRGSGDHESGDKVTVDSVANKVTGDRGGSDDVVTGDRCDAGEGSGEGVQVGDDVSAASSPGARIRRVPSIPCHYGSRGDDDSVQITVRALFECMVDAAVDRVDDPQSTALAKDTVSSPSSTTADSSHLTSLPPPPPPPSGDDRTRADHPDRVRHKHSLGLVNGCCAGEGQNHVAFTTPSSSGLDDDVSDSDFYIALAIQAAEASTRNRARARFRDSSDLIHRLFVCISGVADQLQTNFASDFRHILKLVFLMNTVPETSQCSDDEATSSCDQTNDTLLSSSAATTELPSSADLRSSYPASEVPAVVPRPPTPTSADSHLAANMRVAGDSLAADLMAAASEAAAVSTSSSVVCVPARLAATIDPPPSPCPSVSRAVTSGDTMQRDSPPTGEHVCAPPEWVPDCLAGECMLCSAVFTVMRRRHHCRRCGRVFCGRCSSGSVPLIRYGYRLPVRVCDTCYAIEKH